MSDVSNMISDMVDRLLRDTITPETLASAEAGVWHAELWGRIAESGLPMLLAQASDGGDACWHDAYLIAYACGKYALPMPLPEAMLAIGLLAAAKGEIPAGLVGFGVADAREEMVLRRSRDGWHVSGRLPRVPWGRHLDSVVFLAGEGEKSVVVLAPVERPTVIPGSNLVGEPRDDIHLDGRAVNVFSCPEALRGTDGQSLGALLRSGQMAGAIAATLDMSVSYSKEREQFGRPVARFQAVQHLLAVLAEEAAAAAVASEQAFLALDLRADLEFASSVAKIRTGEAAGRAAAISHQVLGAMGFAQEHALHHWTRRLWAWRAEFGSEAFWALRVGRLVVANGASRFWPSVAEAYSPVSQQRANT
jgi:acyl-CoA dehydrogenase